MDKTFAYSVSSRIAIKTEVNLCRLLAAELLDGGEPLNPDSEDACLV